MLIYLSFLIMASFSPGDYPSKAKLLFALPSEMAALRGDDPVDANEVAGAEYPALQGYKKEKSNTLLRAFKNRNAKKREKAIKDMVKLGRAVIPLLFENAGKADEPQCECIVQSLDALTDERDIALLEGVCISKNKAFRAFAVRKISGFRKEVYHDLIKKALDDKAEEVRLEAALGLAWLKDPAGLGEIITRRSKDLKSPPQRLIEVLPNLRGELMYRRIFDYLVYDKDAKVRTAAVVTLTEIGGTSVTYLLKKALDDPYDQVQRAAVNGLRKLVDNAPPGKFDTLFELVEEVNRWKNRLSAVKQNG